MAAEPEPTPTYPELAIGDVAHAHLDADRAMTLLIVGRTTRAGEPVIASEAERGTFITTPGQNIPLTLCMRGDRPAAREFALALRERTLSDAGRMLLDRALALTAPEEDAERTAPASTPTRPRHTRPVGPRTQSRASQAARSSLVVGQRRFASLKLAT
ncbi:Hypothetical protein PFR_JS12-1_787 [Propionibacterium freudenreichii]|uniref:hypothetical protein n=1 Tax=Propionibacterium freudenreichii TaxID=1744 RepID=UPI000BC3180E|nr:hypothetical protein [Propionibacterium freudenreichii]SBN95169.1 Hypothetical protein PFR_JS12-2_785 [Propionibacterium freudenreichii]SCC96755.1 Hypothetical protein PFR_JS12-1_787 [Propionibacterium freudenreichii]